jgi:hypothetical protein
MKPSHWRLVAFLLVVIVAVVGTWDLRQRGERENAILRQAQVQTCESNNMTRAALRGFLQKTVQPPDPIAYAYITDQKLREGVIAQATERYRSIKRDTDAAFADRDCGALFPKE